MEEMTWVEEKAAKCSTQNAQRNRLMFPRL